MKQGLIKISIIVCTYNGASRLKSVVGSLLDQDYDASRFEVLFIDNASNDNTRQICEDVIRSFPDKRIEYHLERRKGLSHARNRGIKESKGQIVAFIDDDAVADTGWISEIDQALSDESLHAIGGKVSPQFEAPRPQWLSGDIDTILTVLDLGDETIPFRYPYYGPCGTNMAFRKSVFEEVGYFDASLGRRGHKLIGSEETDLFLRVQSAGMKFVYAPACIVHHLVPENRLTKSYIRKRAFHQGYSTALLALKHTPCGYEAIKNVKSVLLEKTAGDGARGFGKPLARKGWFYYEAKAILYASHLFFLVLNALRKPLVFDLGAKKD